MPLRYWRGGISFFVSKYFNHFAAFYNHDIGTAPFCKPLHPFVNDFQKFTQRDFMLPIIENNAAGIWLDLHKPALDCCVGRFFGGCRFQVLQFTVPQVIGSFFALFAGFCQQHNIAAKSTMQPIRRLHLILMRPDIIRLVICNRSFARCCGYQVFICHILSFHAGYYTACILCCQTAF